MKRDTVINVLLVMAGIILAFVLFGAGALWRGKGSKVSFNETSLWSRISRFGNRQWEGTASEPALF